MSYETRQEYKNKMAQKILDGACGYGMADNQSGREDFQKCMDSIPDELIEDFIYTLYRAVDKTGKEAFDEEIF